MSGPAPQIVGPNPNDPALLEPDNRWSNGLNSAVDYAMDKGGYRTDRRGFQGNGDPTGRAAGDNSFYRDNASWMPGWGNTFGLGALDPHGLPSGATAQDRATNYVGHNDPTGVWTDVRANLVTGESKAIGAAKKRGDTHIGFGDVYGAHVGAYADAQAAARRRDPTNPNPAGNSFIDPASFGMAMYGAPMLEHLGINTGPITGASIDLFNDPTDTVGNGWAKRMALSGGEIGVGAGMIGHGLVSGHPLEALGGAALAGTGLFSGAWNTATAIKNGLTPGGAMSGLGHVAGSTARAVGSMASDAGQGIANGMGRAGRAAGNAAASGWSAAKSGWHSLWN